MLFNWQRKRSTQTLLTPTTLSNYFSGTNSSTPPIWYSYSCTTFAEFHIGHLMLRSTRHIESSHEFRASYLCVFPFLATKILISHLWRAHLELWYVVKWTSVPSPNCLLWLRIHQFNLGSIFFLFTDLHILKFRDWITKGIFEIN